MPISITIEDTIKEVLSLYCLGLINWNNYLWEIWKHLLKWKCTCFKIQLLYFYPHHIPWGTLDTCDQIEIYKCIWWSTNSKIFKMSIINRDSVVYSYNTIEMNKPDLYSTDKDWIQLWGVLISKRFKWIFNSQHFSILNKLNQKKVLYIGKIWVVCNMILCNFQYA